MICSGVFSCSAAQGSGRFIRLKRKRSLPGAAIFPENGYRKSSSAVPVAGKRCCLRGMLFWTITGSNVWKGRCPAFFLPAQLNQGLNFAAMAEITGPRKKQLRTVNTPTCPPSRKPMTVTAMS